MNVATVVHREASYAGAEVTVVIVVQFVAPLLADGLFVDAHAAKPLCHGAPVVLTTHVKLFDFPVWVHGANQLFDAWV